MELFKKLYQRCTAALIWKLLSIFPLPIKKNKIVFSSFYTRGYSDNSKAIADEIIRQKLPYELICLTNDTRYLPKEIKAIRAGSLRGIYHMATSGVWIDNCRKPSYVKKRNGQFYIQTWHGFPLKQIEKDVQSKLSRRYVKAAINDAAMCDLMVSNSGFLTKIYKQSFWYDGEVLTGGSPRDDILFRENDTNIAMIKEKIGLHKNQKALLYAPTFRKDLGLQAYDMDYARIVKALQQKFGGKWVILLRLHPNIAGKSQGIKSPNTIDVSRYHDPQKLLLASDALITDYSSIMFDFMLTKKPGFLYANDIDQYKRDRNFYYDIEKIPYSLATSNANLLESIRDFDAGIHTKRIDTFLKEFDIVDTGNAALAVVSRIKQWIEG